MSLLVFNKNGIYCPQADVYLDAWRKVPKCIVTHGHSDHARYGHGQYITHKTNIPIIKHRLGKLQVKGLEWNETLLVNGVKFSLHPAGHIPGSAQVRVAYQGEVWVFTGDYKLQDDGLSTPFEPIKCHTFISECTFGLPAFSWEPQKEVFNEIDQWWAQNKANGVTSLLFGYSLGKAQRLLKNVNPDIGQIYVHKTIYDLNKAMAADFDLPEFTLLDTAMDKAVLKGSLIVAPPGVQNAAWIRKIGPQTTAAASGWMTFRGARRRRALDKGFVLSDHADWEELLTAVKATGCEQVIATHGYTDIFSRYLREELGLDAKTEATAYEAETIDETQETA
ncbi:ligase-associated DNA damage response exonuclease [Gilvibacter sp.]|uniref:ligase-associated DNA damage response exonuclease n=1 Tax=Gilvibacter sp. TaxID=2729997 RepID=UPI003B522B4A